MFFINAILFLFLQLINYTITFYVINKIVNIKNKYIP